MSRKPALVRQSTITKALKGALKAGAKVQRVEIGADGRIDLYLLEQLPPGSPEGNEWDDVK